MSDDRENGSQGVPPALAGPHTIAPALQHVRVEISGTSMATVGTVVRADPGLKAPRFKVRM